MGNRKFAGSNRCQSQVFCEDKNSRTEAGVSILSWRNEDITLFDRGTRVAVRGSNGKGSAPHGKIDLVSCSRTYT